MTPGPATRSEVRLAGRIGLFLECLPRARGHRVLRSVLIMLGFPEAADVIDALWTERMGPPHRPESDA